MDTDGHGCGEAGGGGLDARSAFGVRVPLGTALNAVPPDLRENFLTGWTGMDRDAVGQGENITTDGHGWTRMLWGRGLRGRGGD